ncbi:hypothetical protein AOQ84DRAFT_286265, partial [Glonium stellatum]
MFDSDPSLSHASHASPTDRHTSFYPELLAFASPGSEEQVGGRPEDVLADGPAPFILCDPLFEAAVPASIPRPTGSLSAGTATPSQDLQPAFFPFIGFATDGLLASTAAVDGPPPSALPATLPVLKPAVNLRLPSFDLLGIAAPHPDRIVCNPDNPFSSLGAGPLSNPEDPLHALSPALNRPHALGGREDPPTSCAPEHQKDDSSQFHHFVPTFTPPAEPGTINWGTFANVTTAAMDSPAKSDPGTLSAALASPSTSAAESNTTSQDAPGLGHTIVDKSWIDGAKAAIIANLLSTGEETVKVLSHALPCPSRAGHVFPIIIDAIHRQTPNKPTSWINVFHAVPGRFNLADLPTSPPGTPGPAIGGDDYFTSKVFDSAVPVSDYQGDSTLLPPSPRPVVVPLTVDVSIVERYIPPTNRHEFADLFTTTGRSSLLLDRLIELSPNNGALLFIYPTRAGARTFMNDYLGPVLDPLLRAMAVVHELSADLGTSLGAMPAADLLPDFRALRARLEAFCARLSGR